MRPAPGIPRPSFRDRLTLVMPNADYHTPYLRHLDREGFDGDLILLDFGRERLDRMGL